MSYLNLWNNELSGTIPARLGELSSLFFLSLSGNRLTGPIPPDLGNLQNLQYLYLFDNALTGSIPTQLGQLGALTTLLLQENELSGSIPSELGNIGTLVELDLYDNHLTGPIPSQLSNIGTVYFLSILDIHGNDLSGLIPEAVVARGAEALFLCAFSPGNSDLYMPDVPTYRALDTDADGFICGLSFTASPSTVAGDIGHVIDDFLTSGIVNGGQANALMRKVDQALKLHEKDKDAAAISVLEDFIQQLNDLTYVDHVLTPAQGDELITRAQILIELL